MGEGCFGCFGWCFLGFSRFLSFSRCLQGVVFLRFSVFWSQGFSILDVFYVFVKVFSRLSRVSLKHSRVFLEFSRCFLFSLFPKVVLGFARCLLRRLAEAMCPIQETYRSLVSRWVKKFLRFLSFTQ